VHRHTRRAFRKRFPYLYYRIVGERLVSTGLTTGSPTRDHIDWSSS
jgi:hypothetical protein